MKNLFHQFDEEKNLLEDVNIKKDLEQGILVLVGYFQVLVTPDMPEYQILLKLGGQHKRYSEAHKQFLLKKLVEQIGKIV